MEEAETVSEIEEPSLRDKVLYLPEWFNEQSVEERQEEKIEDIREVASTSNNVLISDSDTDGLSTAAIVMEAMDDVGMIVNGHGSLVDLSEVLSEVNENYSGDGSLIVCDLMPDGDEFDDVMDELDKFEGQVEFFDHHQWDEEMLKKLDEVADFADVRPEEEVCTANIAFERFEDEFDGSDREQYEELASVVRDHDIWVKEDERSDDLSEFHQNSEEDEFMEAVRELGANVMEDDEIRETVEEARAERERKVEYQVKNMTQWFEVFELEDGLSIWMDGKNKSIDRQKANGHITVAVSYGSAYRSEVGNVLCEGWDEDYEQRLDEYPSYDDYYVGEADLAIVIQPYNKVSLRSSEDFQQCDVIAGCMGGGGHNQAAGFKTETIGNDVTYDEHREERGETTMKRVLDGITTLIEDDKVNLS